MVTTKLMTAEDLERFAPGDDYRYELIRGELKRMSPAGLDHAEYVGYVYSPLSHYVRAQGLGKVYVGDPGFVVARDPDIVLAPDVAFVRADRLPPKEERIRFGRLAPDLAVEMISPSERAGEIAEKVAMYLEAGVPVVWLFYPNRQIVRVHAAGQQPVELSLDEVLDGGDVVPGFQLRIADVFQ